MSSPRSHRCGYRAVRRMLWSGFILALVAAAGASVCEAQFFNTSYGIKAFEANTDGNDNAAFGY